MDVFPKWKEVYPAPVDLIGVTRIYQPEIDKPVKTALQVRFADSRRCSNSAISSGFDRVISRPRAAREQKK